MAVSSTNFPQVEPVLPMAAISTLLYLFLCTDFVDLPRAVVASSAVAALKRQVDVALVDTVKGGLGSDYCTW